MFSNNLKVNFFSFYCRLCLEKGAIPSIYAIKEQEKKLDVDKKPTLASSREHRAIIRDALR